MSCAAVIFVSLLTTTVGTAVGSSDQVAAQATPAQTATAPAASASTTSSDTLPVSLDHIRKALDDDQSRGADAPDAPKLRVDASTLPVFRTRTTSTGVRLSNILDDGTNVGPYVRPANGLYDYTFKQMVTPDPVKGCGRLTSSECLQLYTSELTSLLWQRVTQHTKTQP